METNQDKTTHDQKEAPAFRPPKVQNFRTLKSDMIGAVKKQDKSLAQVVLSAKEKKWTERKGEGEKLEKVYVENKYKKIKYKLFLVGTIVIIGSLFGVKLFVFSENNPHQEGNYSLASLPITERVDLNVLGLGSTTLAEKIPLAEKNSNLYDGDVVVFKIIKPTIASSSPKALSSKDFTILWADNVPKELLSRISHGSYLVGRYSAETVHTFVIYELTETEENMSLLKSWEENIMKDTKSLFVGQKEPSKNIFVNALVNESQSVRLLEHDTNEPAVVYGFVDKSLLVISDSADIFIKILSTK